MSFALLLGITSCSTKENLVIEKECSIIELGTKSVVPETFDWENEDYMPTPSTQTILVPWATGSGGLDAFYGLDVVLDYKKVDGWKQVYSSFKSSGPNLIDPYFVLYNVYRGTLRIYIYLTSITNNYSSYIQDYVYLNTLGSVSSPILNYLGSVFVDKDINIKAFNSIRPKPLSGGSPLANNQWYMIEYEMAYDPGIGNLTYDQIRFQISSDYSNIETINLSGEEKTEISGTIGASSTSAQNLISSELSSAKKGVAGIIGYQVLNALGKIPTNGATSNNKVGIDSLFFTNLVSAVTGMVNTFFSGIPSFAYSLLNAIICGSSSTAGSMVSLKAETEIQLEGSATNSGAVGNWSMYIPGTYIPGTVQGYIPLYNEPMGVFYYSGNNTLYMQQQTGVWPLEIERNGVTEYYTESITLREIAFDPDGENYAHNLIFNPAVEELADISVVKEDLITRYPNGNFTVNELEIEGYVTDCPYINNYPIPNNLEYGVRFLVEVQPKSGAPASYIYKTFKLQDYLVGGRGQLPDAELKKRVNKYHTNERND